MTPLVATRGTIARPLKVLVPLIRHELEAGQDAGLEHYRRAGEMLLEAKEQMPYGNWGRWLGKHFALSSATAYRYMTLAQRPKTEEVFSHGRKPSLRAAIGRTADYAKWKPLQAAARDLDADLFAQERQSRDEEIDLCRSLAKELIDLGYKALATRLHPDRGGSKDAMARLSRVRDELKEVAKIRRFV